MNKTILIGPTGFLGISFLEHFPELIAVGRTQIQESLNNRFIQLDTENYNNSLDNVDFDNVIFLIGSSDHEVLNNHPTLALERNVLELGKFLHYLKTSKRKVNKIITFTTMLQYDSIKMKLPCPESEAKNPFVNNYVFSKYVAELLTQQYRNLFQIIDIRLSNVYGPTILRRPDLIPTLIWKILDNKNNSAIDVWTKKPKRDFVYVKDVIDAVILLLESDFSGALNLGSGTMNSVGDVCNILHKLSGYEFNDLNKEVTGHMEYCHDLTLIKSIIDWSPKFTLEDGLKETFKIMNKNIIKR